MLRVIHYFAAQLTLGFFWQQNRYISFAMHPRLFSISRCIVAAGAIYLACCWDVPVRADVFSNVPEAAGYQLLYTLPIPNTANYGGTSTPAYSVNNAAKITGSISRVAYYLELQTSGGTLQYAYMSMDAFTQNLKLLGVPVASTGAYFDQNVFNVNIFSNVSGITTGTGLTGNLEFFSGNYTTGNGIGVPNASGSTLDFGDTAGGPHGGGNYGSFQIANHDAKQNVINYNRWGGTGGTSDVGLGTYTSSYPDYSFAQNASSYTVKNLQVLVKTGTAPTRVQIMPLGDSITDGYKSVQGGGYRAPLADSLTKAGVSFAFIGSTGDSGSAGGGASPTLQAASQQQHEGHSGYRIDQITNNLSGNDSSSGNDGGYWLTDNPGVQPGYVLLMIGTNDINGAYDPAASSPTDAQFVADAIARLKTLLDTLFAARPSTHVFLASVLPIQNNATALTRVSLFNNSVKNVILANSSYAGKITYVDQYDSFLNADGSINTSIYADGIHPNDTGYAVLASNWFNAIAAYPGPSIATQPASQNIITGTSVTFSVLATGSGSGTLTYQWYKESNAIANATFPSYTINSSTTAAAGSYHVVVTNSAGAVTSATATLTLTEPVDEFLASYGLPNSALLADSDGDGLPNLLEFVLGGNLLATNPGVLPTLTLNSGGSEAFAFNVPSNLGSVVWTAEYSFDLINWTTAVAGQSGVAISTAAVGASVNHIVVTFPSNGNRQFVRLRASLP